MNFCYQKNNFNLFYLSLYLYYLQQRIKPSETAILYIFWLPEKCFYGLNCFTYFLLCHGSRDYFISRAYLLILR